MKSPLFALSLATLLLGTTAGPAAASTPAARPKLVTPPVAQQAKPAQPANQAKPAQAAKLAQPIRIVQKARPAPAAQQKKPSRWSRFRSAIGGLANRIRGGGATVQRKAPQNARPAAPAARR